MVKGTQDPQSQSPESGPGAASQGSQITVDLIEIQKIIGDLALTLASERTRATRAEQVIQNLLRERETLIVRIRSLEGDEPRVSVDRQRS
jgi:hypothetical protein